MPENKSSRFTWQLHTNSSCNLCDTSVWEMLKTSLLSSSRTRVRVKLGVFNAKIRNENHHYIRRLIYQLNEQDLLCHSI